MPTIRNVLKMQKALSTTHTIFHCNCITILTACRDEFIRYRIAVCDAKSKFCDAKLNVIRRKLRCEAILTASKKMLFVCDFRAYMSACTRTVFQCAIKDRRCTRFSFTCRGARAPDSCYFLRMPYARRFLDFCVRRFELLITSCKLRLTE